MNRLAHAANGNTEVAKMKKDLELLKRTVNKQNDTYKEMRGKMKEQESVINKKDEQLLKLQEEVKSLRNNANIAQTRILGLQMHRMDTVNQAVGNNDGRTYVEALQSNGLWATLKYYENGGDRLVPGLVRDDLDVVKDWDEETCNYVRKFILDNKRELLRFEVLIKTYQVATGQKYGKRSSSAAGLSEPAAKKPAVAVEEHDTLTKLLVTLTDRVLAVEHKQQATLPTTQLGARSKMYNTSVHDAERKPESSKLAKDRVQGWLRGKGSFPKFSDVYRAMNRDKAFDPTDLSQVQAALLYLVAQLHKIDDIDTEIMMRNITLIEDILVTLDAMTLLDGSLSTTKSTLEHWVRDVTRNGNFKASQHYISMGQILGVQVKPEPTNTKYSSGSTKTTAGYNNRRGGGQRTGHCYFCKQSTHRYADCSYRLNTSTMPPSDFFCIGFNTSRGGCSLSNNQCTKMHRCSSCNGSHGAYECQSRQ